MPASPYLSTDHATLWFVSVGCWELNPEHPSFMHALSLSRTLSPASFFQVLLQPVPRSLQTIRHTNICFPMPLAVCRLSPHQDSDSVLCCLYVSLLPSHMTPDTSPGTWWPSLSQLKSLHSCQGPRIKGTGGKDANAVTLRLPQNSKKATFRVYSSLGL